MKQNLPLLLGAHISIEGGLEKAIIRGEEIGCTVIQIFTKNNRQWKSKPIDEKVAHLFQSTVQKSSIKTVVAHASYLINIGAKNMLVRKQSTEALIDELHRCSQLGIPFLVLHPGTKHEEDDQKCLSRIAEQCDLVLKKTPKNTTLLLETMAGQGNNLCYTFEQLAYIFNKVSTPSRLGICLDTCHIFAAGYGINTEESYDAMWRSFDKILGLNLLKVIHVNDSKKELGSRIDRHEHIGRGEIGKNGFLLLMNDSRFFRIPKILETPKDTLASDLHNMKTLIALLNTKNKKLFNVK